MRRGFGYEDKEEEKHLLLTHEEWLARTKKNDVVDSFFQVREDVTAITRKTEIVNVVMDMVVDVVVEEVVAIPHKPMTSQH